MLTCDRWQKLEHNIYALHLCFRQWRNMDQWGIATLPTLMAGFEVDRTPDKIGASEDAMECLSYFGLGNNATLDDAVAIYHRRAKTFSQDTEGLTKLNLAMDELRDYFSKKS